LWFLYFPCLQQSWAEAEADAPWLIEAAPGAGAMRAMEARTAAPAVASVVEIVR